MHTFKIKLFMLSLWFSRQCNQYVSVNKGDLNWLMSLYNVFYKHYYKTEIQNDVLITILLKYQYICSNDESLLIRTGIDP